MDFKTIPIKLSDEISEIMETRGIKEDDIREVLEYGETSGRKLYVEGENRFLTKKKLNSFTPNVEYSISDDGIEILNLYSYIISFSTPAGE